MVVRTALVCVIERLGRKKWPSTCIYAWDTTGVEHTLILRWAHWNGILKHELKGKKENRKKWKMTKARKPALLETDRRGATGGMEEPERLTGKVLPRKRRETDGWGILKNTTNWREWLEGMGKGLIADPISPACYRLEKYACLGQNKLYFCTIGAKTVIPIRTYNHLQCQTVPNSFVFMEHAGETGIPWGQEWGGGIRGELDPKLVCDNNAPSSYPVPGLGGGTYWTSAPIGRSKEELFYPVQRAAPEKTSRPQVWNRNNHIYVIWYEIQREEEHTLWS